MTKLKIKTGGPTKPKISLTAKGIFVPMPFFAGPAYLSQDPDVTIQLYNEDSLRCWSQNYVPSSTDDNVITRFRAKTP